MAVVALILGIAALRHFGGPVDGVIPWPILALLSFWGGGVGPGADPRRLEAMMGTKTAGPARGPGPKPGTAAEAAGGQHVPLGFEVGTGEPVSVPVRHMAVTGQTQESGKTTTLEALIARGAEGGLRAVAFVTKRGERSFRGGRRVPPYFRERTDWQFVAALLEATMRERMKFQRPWIMRACRGAAGLADVQRNVRKLMEGAKRGMDQDQYLALDHYLDIVVPQIARLPYTRTLELGPGINVMDLGAYTSEMQALVVRSAIEWVYERETGVVVVIPEAWEFVPQRRGSPVKLACEELIRKGAGLRNYIWLDSQDLAGVDAAVRKQVVVWLLGVQREANEVKRTLEHVTAPKPSAEELMTLGLGEFYACWGTQVRRVYVQPEWMDAGDAQSVARGEAAARGARFYRDEGAWTVDVALQEDAMSAEERERYEAEIGRLTDELARARTDAQRAAGEAAEWSGKAAEADRLRAENASLRRQIEGVDAMKRAFTQVFGNPPTEGTPASFALDEDAIVGKVLARLPSAGAAAVQVAAPQAILKAYQRQEVDRLLARVRAMTPRERASVLLLEASGQAMSQKVLCERLGIPTKGGSWWTASTSSSDGA